MIYEKFQNLDTISSQNHDQSSMIQSSHIIMWFLLPFFLGHFFLNILYWSCYNVVSEFIKQLEMARQRPTRIPTPNVWPRCAPGLVMGPCIVEIDRIVIREVQYQFEVNPCRNEEIIVNGNFWWVWPMWAGRPRVGNGAMHGWDWPYCHKRGPVSIWSESV